MGLLGESVAPAVETLVLSLTVAVRLGVGFNKSNYVKRAFDK